MGASLLALAKSIYYNLICSSKHKPSGERIASKLTCSEDSRGKLTCFSDWLTAITQVFRQTEPEKRFKLAGEQIDKVLNIWMLLIRKEYISTCAE